MNEAAVRLHLERLRAEAISSVPALLLYGRVLLRVRAGCDAWALHASNIVHRHQQHNEANLEDNRDGNNNLSWNCGAESATDDPGVNALRAPAAQFHRHDGAVAGVLMLLAGDEFARTQRGNNNAYCQDSDISCVNWDLNADQTDPLVFTRRVLRIRREYPVFRRRNFFQGRAIRGRGVRDLLWLMPEGREMHDQEWALCFARCLGVFFSGDALNEADWRGRPIMEESFLILINAHHEPIDFHLPSFHGGFGWLTLLDTTHEQGLPPSGRLPTTSPFRLTGRSLALLQEVREKS